MNCIVIRPHPYTEVLLAAIPGIDPKRRTKRTLLSGEMPSPLDPTPGCPFNPRCYYKQSKCIAEKPNLKKLIDGKFVACHYPLGLNS